LTYFSFEKCFCRCNDLIIKITLTITKLQNTRNRFYTRLKNVLPFPSWSDSSFLCSDLNSSYPVSKVLV
jgi:hypothetical protein